MTMNNNKIGEQIVHLALLALLSSNELAETKLDVNEKNRAMIHNFNKLTEGLEELVYDFCGDPSEFHDLSIKAEAFTNKLSSKAKLPLYAFSILHLLNNAEKTIQNSYNRRILPHVKKAIEAIEADSFAMSCLGKKHVKGFHSHCEKIIVEMGVECRIA